ncbi:hypothetical protein RR46_14189 [Papilio xuthus]|uniref:Uncharacterized protein n=1 Tax=Papilio xuthus TaxID=66420 RepID=A0A194PIU2_PAPXU|nr:hypothetical protein RR46_14189 [Papilio xuthus]
MKILLLLSLILLYCQSYQCGVVKELVETAANEVNKIAGYNENIAANKSENTSDVQNKDQTIEINAKEYENTKHNISTKVINTELQNSANIQNQRNNTPVQVNVDITLVVNYNKPNTNPNEESNKDNTEKNHPNTNETVTDANLINIDQNSIKISTVDVQQTNTNIKFPGPMNTPIITYNDGVVVVETNTVDDKVLFPDSKINVTLGCPDGMISTENGDCIIKGRERPKIVVNGDNDDIPRSAFSGGCFQGYARALDGSCQQIIED